jgi:hypothetical protein
MLAMDLTTDIADGSTTIKLSDGLQIRVPKLNSTPTIAVHDIQNVTTALLELIANLDSRLAIVEGRAKAAAAGQEWGSTLGPEPIGGPPHLIRPR